MMADNSSSGLESLCGETAAATLPLSDHLPAFLAGGDAVAVAFEDFLGNPPDEDIIVLGFVEFLSKLRFKLFDV